MSEKRMPIYGHMRVLEINFGVGKNVKSIFAKSRTETLAILGIFKGYLELESIF